MIKVGINGFGRIGRSAFKIALDKYADQIEIVAINDLTSPEILAHLLQYDSAYGRWDKEVFTSPDTSTTSTTISTSSLSAGSQSITIEDKKYPIMADPSAGSTGSLQAGSGQGSSAIIVEGKKYPIYAEKIPINLHWGNLGVDVVLECTGRFTKEDDARQHILAGAKKVILSAPGKSTSEESKPTSEVSVPTYLMGVNHDQYHGEEVISNASCTTNCIAPVMTILQEKFGVLKAVMTTVHAVTAEQNLVDGPPPGGKSNDLRRARAAYSNIIPTSTGAAISVTEVLPELKGKFDGRALRVPVIVGSISDITCVFGKKTSVEEVNEAFRAASNEERWKGIVTWSEKPLVSTDIIGNTYSAIVDLPLTQVVDGDLVKIFAWYDNEFGYSNRLIEMAINISK